MVATALRFVPHAARSLSLLIAAAWLAALPLQGQSLDGGALLVANESLKDPNFTKAVVLILRHDAKGTIGVVINRLTSLPPAQVFPELGEGLGGYQGKLFRGGPVSPSRLLFLVRGLAAATVQGPEIVDKVFLSGDPEGLQEMTRLADGTNELRMFAGHAEWMAGQIESEIENGDWHVVPGSAALVFSGDPRKLWSDLASRGDEVVVDASSR